MSHPELRNNDDFSLFSIGTTLLRSRWRILRWSLAFGVLAALTVIGKPKVYKASASFIAQGTDQGRSNLATLAGQFGVAIPNSGTGLTPEFYVTLVKSPVVLRAIALDTFTVAEMGGRRIGFLDLFQINEGTRQEQLEEAVRVLTGIVTVSLAKPTGVIEVTASTKWPSVSLAVTEKLLAGVNGFNLHTRQSQAASERKFVEGRLSVAASDLREAEDRLARFLVSNRQYAASPELSFQYDRLLREVGMKQGVYSSLNQAYEEVRLREVRDTPVITVVEPPDVRARAQPRGRVVRVAIALMAGAVIGAVLSLLSAIVTRRKREGDAEVNEFIGTLTELRGAVVQRVPWIGERARR